MIERWSIFTIFLLNSRHASIFRLKHFFPAVFNNYFIIYSVYFTDSSINLLKFCFFFLINSLSLIGFRRRFKIQSLGARNPDIRTDSAEYRCKSSKPYIKKIQSIIKSENKIRNVLIIDVQKLKR